MGVKNKKHEEGDNIVKSQGKFWISFLIFILVAGGLLFFYKSKLKTEETNLNNESSQGKIGPELPTLNNNDIYLISGLGIGPIRLGATLDDARKALPTAEFERTSDGDGVALINVKLANKDLMVLYAGEDDPDAPIDWSKKISFIETFNPSCHIKNGIHPGSLVRDIENLLGGIKVIVKSEIESREYISFKKQSSQFIFRLDYTGIFASNSRHTTKVDPKGKIYSISVSLR